MTFPFNDKYYNIMDNYAICCLCLTKLHDCIHQRSKQTYKEENYMILTIKMHETIDMWNTVSAQKFLRVIFVIFPAIHKNKFPHIKITTNIFPKNWHQSKYSLT